MLKCKSLAHGRLTALVEQVMWQIGEYHRHGFEILGVIGANRSPDCGVETTSAGNVETAGMGLFMDALSRAMEEAGISIPMTGLKASDSLEEKLPWLYAADG